MNRLTTILLTLFISVTTPVFATTPNNNDPILLHLPESVIQSAASAILPVALDASSKSLQGDITIVSVKNLQITKGHLSCNLQLAGKNLRFLTEIAGHQINLKVGNVEIGFQTDAEVRFDPKNQILFLRPIVKDVTGSGDGHNGEIGKALLALLNGREFPVALQDIKPILAKSGAKLITIQPHIDDIQAIGDKLVLKMIPEITVAKAPPQ